MNLTLTDRVLKMVEGDKYSWEYDQAVNLIWQAGAV